MAQHPRSDWRRLARGIIARVLASLPADATPQEKRRAVSAAYPRPPREHHPYHCWLKEVRFALGGQSKKPMPTPEVIVSPEGVNCGWCQEAVTDRCLACSNAWWAFNNQKTDWIRWQQWLDVIAEDPEDITARLAFADWLSENSWDEQAALVRRKATKGITDA